MINRIIGIGNALTDILINLRDDRVLQQFGLERGSMSLMETEEQQRVAEAVASLPHTQSLGGSAANTIRALAHMGIPVGFIGKVGRDATGDFFEASLRDQGIEAHLLRSATPSGCCISLVSPDGERTMCTALSAAREMTAEEISTPQLAGYDCLYVEGYLLQDHTLIRQVIRTAQAAGMKVALDLASFNVVEENLDFLRQELCPMVDILFANEQEATAFTGERNPLEALDRLSHLCEIVVVKVGTRGAYVKYRGKVDHVGILSSARRVDSTGAGDFYAAGFLYGLCHRRSMVECGTIGSIVAGQVIEVVGTTFDEAGWQHIAELTRQVEEGSFLL
ncbi:MAG: adenosine kinase [Alistipes sp.]|nr:adenosine kinase [Alistipes sp.]